MPEGTPLEQTRAAARARRLPGPPPEVTRLPGLRRHRFADQLQRPGAAVLPAQRRHQGDLQVTLLDKAPRAEKSHAIVKRLRPGLQESADVSAPRSSSSRSAGPAGAGAAGRRDLRARSLGPAARWRAPCAPCSRQTPGVVDVDDSSIAAAPRKLVLIDRRKAALLGVPQATSSAPCAPAGGRGCGLAARREQVPRAGAAAAAGRAPRRTRCAAAAAGARSGRQLGADPRARHRHRHRARAAGPSQGPAAGEYVIGDVAGRVDSPLYGMFAARRGVAALKTPGAARRSSTSSASRATPIALRPQMGRRMEGHLETFRDMASPMRSGWSSSICWWSRISAPTCPAGHHGADSAHRRRRHARAMPCSARVHRRHMIGMIALAGIIVRNSILLVDFINLKCPPVSRLKDATIRSASARTQPILLTAVGGDARRASSSSTIRSSAALPSR